MYKNMFNAHNVWEILHIEGEKMSFFTPEEKQSLCIIIIWNSGGWRGSTNSELCAAKA